MNARLPAKNVLNNKAKRAADIYVREQQADMIRRIMKIVILSLNEEYGFGRIRCGRVLSAINRAAEEQQHDEVFWTHVDRRVRQLGFDFTAEDWERGFS